MRWITILFFLLFSAKLLSSPKWHWEDRFSQKEQNGLTAWVRHAETGLTSLFGPLSFDYRVFFHRRESHEEPVPWANTWKNEARDVHFYVAMSHSMDAFMDDWTAPHELAHLIFPYLGDRGRWFAEGIASYLEYQVMYANGTISWDEAMANYRDRFHHAHKQGPYDLSIVQLSPVVNEYRSYVRLYWGGACYFMRADKRLFEEKGIRLNDVIREYMNCCSRRNGTSIKRLIRQFDVISGSTIFTETLHVVQQAGFPKMKNDLAWLTNHPPTLLTLKDTD